MPKLDVERVKCNNCGKKSSMVVQDTTNASIFGDEDFPHDFVLQFLTCPACNKMNITMYDEDSASDTVIYPPKPRSIETKELLGLPPAIEDAYKIAQQVREIDTNLLGVQLGRILDLICIDKNAKGDSLFERIRYLTDQGELPKRLAEMANQLRALRNIAAHADAGSLTSAEIPILDKLCEVILEYLYHAPKLIEQVEQRLAKLKGK